MYKKKNRHLADELVPKVPIVLREFIFSIFLSDIKIKISVITELRQLCTLDTCISYTSSILTRRIIIIMYSVITQTKF